MENRRLAAVLIADIAGYTRLVEQDTDATVAAWKAARAEVIEPQIAKHSGRIVKLTGDGFLAEFPVVQDAVLCAIAMQQGLATSSLDFRMGVNLGDIVDDGQDIHGEGVNIAARIEAMADEGGISISGDVYSQVRNRLDAVFTDRGEHAVKHVSHPVRVYAVQTDPVQVKTPEPVQLPNKPAEKASIAILPFDNISNDPEQEYFCDGVVEDIITEISKFRWLSVIARNSTFTYKGKSVDIKTVGEELGARYVVEGSVRKAGNRIRVTAQLIDSTDGSHVWAERYDRELADIFDLQDEITQTLVATIEPELAAAEKTRARKKPTENLDAWELVQKASWVKDRFNAEAHEEAQRLLDYAIILDPEIAYAYALKGYIDYASVIMGYADDPGETLRRSVTSAKKAISLDEREVLGYRALGSAQSTMGLYDEALKSFDHAIEINPNYASAYMGRSLSMILSENYDGEATKKVAETALRLSPKDTTSWGVLNVLGFVYSEEGDLEKAAEFYQASCRQPITTYFPFFYLAITLKKMGRHEEAETAFATAMEMGPTFTLEKQRQQIGNFAVARMEANGSIQLLRDLGLPEA
jgi:adenylate cyclase